jgi:hypothetical protein
MRTSQKTAYRTIKAGGGDAVRYDRVGQFEPYQLHHQLVEVVSEIEHSQCCRNIKDMCAELSDLRRLCWRRRGE